MCPLKMASFGRNSVWTRVLTIFNKCVFALPMTKPKFEINIVQSSARVGYNYTKIRLGNN